LAQSSTNIGNPVTDRYRDNSATNAGEYNSKVNLLCLVHGIRVSAGLNENGNVTTDGYEREAHGSHHEIWQRVFSIDAHMNPIAEAAASLKREKQEHRKQDCMGDDCGGEIASHAKDAKGYDAEESSDRYSHANEVHCVFAER